MLLDILLYIVVVSSTVMLVIHIILASGILLNKIRDLLDGKVTADLSVSVVVVAKDEEQLLPRLLVSLEKQSYKDFEIVLVDDRSTDRTLQIMEEFRLNHGRRVKVIHNQQKPEAVNPKQFALDLAVEVARGDVIAFTDADCIVPKSWIEDHLLYFKNPKVGVVFGQICLPEVGNFFERYQAFVQPLLHQYHSGTAGIGMPTGCFGNNLVVRASVLEEIGGFRALGFTLTEDSALIAAVSKRKWKIRVSTRRSTTIETFPVRSWHQFVHQHLRWNSSAYYFDDGSTRLSYRLIVFFLWISLGTLAFSPLLPLLLVLSINAFISLAILGLLSGVLYSRNKVVYLLLLIPNTLFFLFFYAFISFLCVCKVAPKWKGLSLKLR